MQITLDSSDRSINWGATGAEEIVQNCLTLIRTMQYEVAYDRTLGISPDFVDMPAPEAVAFTTAQIYRVIEEREPRARVVDVQLDGVSDDGQLDFKVGIDI